MQPLDAAGYRPGPTVEQIGILELEDIQPSEGRLDLFLRRERHAKDTDRPGNVFQFVVAEVDELE